MVLQVVFVIHQKPHKVTMCGLLLFHLCILFISLFFFSSGIAMSNSVLCQWSSIHSLQQSQQIIQPLYKNLRITIVWQQLQWLSGTKLDRSGNQSSRDRSCSFSSLWYFFLVLSKMSKNEEENCEWQVQPLCSPKTLYVVLIVLIVVLVCRPNVRIYLLVSHNFVL